MDEIKKLAPSTLDKQLMDEPTPKIISVNLKSGVHGQIWGNEDDLLLFCFAHALGRPG